MNPTKILWGQILLVCGTVLIFVWAATEWTAWKLGFQPQLGQPWFEIFGWPFYHPPAFFWWWFAYDAYARNIFVEGAYIAASGGIAAIAVAITMSVWRARETKHVTTYGSARWSETREIRRAGLLNSDGVLLGRWHREYLCHDGPEHVLCFAPTRSGKGVGLVVPTLLTWPGSAIVHDIKGENWTLTAGWRARFGRVLLFDPTNILSAAYNPLLEVRRGEWEVRDVQNIADVLVDPEGALERRNHWEKTSHSLLVGTILHVLYAEPDKTLAGVANFLSDPRRPIETTLRAMMTTPHLGRRGVHPVVASAARELLNKSENERSGVLSTAMSFLGLYRDPVIAKVTSHCDWRICDLVDDMRPATLYLVVPPSDISRTKPLIRLILNQIGRRLTEELQSKNRCHRLLLMLDEFPALGRLDFFESALAFMAGYGLKAFLIAQSLNQIEKAYGQNNSILDNCHVRVSFATNDERTAKRVSDALGTATELRAMKNYAGSRLSPWLGHLMVSRQETSRPLLTPGEVMQLPPDDELILISGSPPIRAKKARYYEDKQLLRRILPPPKLSPAVNVGASSEPSRASDNRLAFPYRWSTRAICLDKTDATKVLARIRRQWFAKRKSIMAILKEVMTNEASVLTDSDAANKALDADIALQELGSDLVGEAYVTATITVWDNDPRIADDRQRLVEKTIQGRDFTCMRETVNAIEAWLGSLPGHVYANVRQPPISTLNLAHMMPFSAVWAGAPRDEHFQGPPLFFARTEGSTPFRFSLHVGDVGHTLVVGPTGAGKSVLLALMALQFRRYAGAQVFAFDFGGSIRAAALAMGGDWHDLGGALTDDIAEPIALQPLAHIDDAGERAWAAEWIAMLLARESVAVTPELKEHLWSALNSLASAPVSERTLTGLSVLLQSNALKQALQPYTVGGPWGRLLDAESEHLGEAEIQAFETEGLIGASAAPAVLSFLFHRIEDRFDGRPTLLMIDEGWLALDDRGFAGQLREWLKTLRKKNASVIFATQSLADIDGSAIAPAIIESCPTRLFLPNERALEPQIASIYRRFGLNDRQIEILSRATPKRDYYCQSRRGNRLFELGLSEVALAFTAASSKTDQAAIAETLAAFGREGFAAAWLRRKGLDWATDMLITKPKERSS